MSQLSSLPLPTNYTKVYEDENALVAKLIARGLVVDDENELRQILRVVGYYRLTGYLYPFRKAGSEDYEGGTTLASVWRLYSFDRRLRLVAADALARIEVAVRAKTMEYHTAYCNGDPFAYCKQTDMPGLSGQSFVRFVDAVDKAVRQAERANNPAVVHHVALHGQTKVPVWMLMENLSFGDVMVYYRGLPNAVQQKVANDFGIWPSAFRGWLNLLRNARNICAHTHIRGVSGIGKSILRFPTVSGTMPILPIFTPVCLFSPAFCTRLFLPSCRFAHGCCARFVRSPGGLHA